MATKKKTSPKKTAAKKTAKKAPARKAAAKKKASKKAAPKKAAAKKAAPKKASKKVAAKSTTKAGANTRARRPATEKPAKKLPPSKAQKTAALLVAKKAAALKKADRKPKKSDRKKPAPKTPSQRKVAAAPKKAAPKKAAPKKAARHDGDTFHEVILTGEVVALPGKAAPQGDKSAADVASPKATKAAPKKVERGDPAHDLAQLCAAVALDKKAEDVVILEVTQLTTYADCFVVCGAPSERQVQGIARALEDEMKKIGRRAVSTEGLEQGHWVLVDFGAVVVHIFVQNARQYYDLEGFWTDAPRIDVDEKRGIGLSKLLQEEFNQAMAESQAESQSA